MTEDPFLSPSEVENILYQLEQKNLVFKTWDIKKQDYVWHMTESGDELGRILDNAMPNLHILSDAFDREILK